MSFDDKRYILLHKPRGVISARLKKGGVLGDGAEGRDKEALCDESVPQVSVKTVYDVVAEHGFPVDLGLVGRLDKDTSGIILLTDDGRLAKALTAPILVTGEDSDGPECAADNLDSKSSRKCNFCRKVYRLVLNGEKLSDDAFMSTLEAEFGAPMVISRFNTQRETRHSDVSVVRRWRDEALSRGGHPMLGWCVELEVVLTEGKHHQIRRMAKRYRLHVISLCRIGIVGILHIDSVVEEGACRYLTAAEVLELYEHFGL
jgi:16S rRNA U516 pseudouridylate synthase RsuA-like enzyme